MHVQLIVNWCSMFNDFGQHKCTYASINVSILNLRTLNYFIPPMSLKEKFKVVSAYVIVLLP